MINYSKNKWKGRSLTYHRSWKCLVIHTSAVDASVVHSLNSHITYSSLRSVVSIQTYQVLYGLLLRDSYKENVSIKTITDYSLSIIAYGHWSILLALILWH